MMIHEAGVNTDMVQLSVVTIAGYGPWTLTLGSDREHRLQMFQASLYGAVQDLFSKHDCLAFLNRADEFFVASAGVDAKGHAAIVDELSSKFNVKLRVSIGRGPTPAAADRMAHSALMTHLADLQPATGKGGGKPNTWDLIFGPAGHDPVPDTTTIMHMDVDGLSRKLLNTSPYETTLLISGLYQKMSAFFYEHESLAFFMGGDNFMIVASDEAVESSGKFVEMIERQHEIRLNCGIGRGSTSREAARFATESLDMIRDMRDAHSSSGGDSLTGSPGKTWPRVYEHATKKRHL